MASKWKKFKRRYDLHFLRTKPLLWFYAAYLTLRYVDSYNYFPAIKFSKRLRVRIKKSKGAKLVINERLLIEPWLLGNTRVNITLDANATLLVERDFILGDNIKILVAAGGSLIFKGKNTASGSGITANSVILVKQHVEIGMDCIIAWDTFLTDCDWHGIEGKSAVETTIIGNHVWIGVGAKILKGSIIGDDSIVTSNTVVLKGKYAERSMIAGNPGTIIKSSIPAWRRDI